MFYNFPLIHVYLMSHIEEYLRPSVIQFHFTFSILYLHHHHKKICLCSRTLLLGHESLSFQTSNLQVCLKSTLILSSWYPRKEHFSCPRLIITPTLDFNPSSLLAPTYLFSGGSLLSLVSFTTFHLPVSS